MAKKPIESHTPETEPSCADFGICGGCIYLDLPYESELKLKEQKALNLFERAGLSGFSYDGLISSPSANGYKNKMEFTFGDSEKGGELELGIRKKTSRYEVITPRECTIIDSDFKTALLTTLDFFRALGEPFYHKTKHTGTLRNLIVRKAHTTGEIMVNLVTTPQFKADLKPYIESLQEKRYDGRLIGVLHTLCSTVADFIKPDCVKLLYGKNYITEELFGLTFKISPFSFFQTNSLGAQRLYAQVREYALKTNAQTAYDLYSGTGTITQILAGFAENVTGVEVVEEAAAAAKQNAAENGANCRFICADVLDALGRLNNRPELIVLDPPRAGVHPKALTRIADAAPKYIIYVSCKPESLVNDLTVLETSRYKITALKLCDMFPRTAHIESIALIERI